MCGDLTCPRLTRGRSAAERFRVGVPCLLLAWRRWVGFPAVRDTADGKTVLESLEPVPVEERGSGRTVQLGRRETPGGPSEMLRILVLAMKITWNVWQNSWHSINAMC